MTPARLQPEDFRSYPPLARQLAARHIELLRLLPLAFLPLLLRELISYDYKFPVEKQELDFQFRYLEAMAPEQLRQTMRPFAALRITPEMEQLDWINVPAQFAEQATAHLWATHQIDGFRTAAIEYVGKMNASRADDPLPTHRLGTVMIGQGVASSDYPLFRKLRPHGIHYTAVDADRGYQVILEALRTRAAANPAPLSHWHIEGGEMDAAPEGLTCVSYGALRRVRATLQARIQQAYATGMGSEALRSALARMRPEDVGIEDTGDAAVLSRFQLSLLTEGSGTQIFSTTFVQWAAREVWRRAQPLTLSARFTPRQKEDSGRELWSEARRKPVLDPQGSLIDADMGAYYTWINQQRLPGAPEAKFLVWFEGHNEAFAIAPELDKGKEITSRVTLQRLVHDLL